MKLVKFKRKNNALHYCITCVMLYERLKFFFLITTEQLYR